MFLVSLVSLCQRKCVSFYVMQCRCNLPCYGHYIIMLSLHIHAWIFSSKITSLCQNFPNFSLLAPAVECNWFEFTMGKHDILVLVNNLNLHVVLLMVPITVITLLCKNSTEISKLIHQTESLFKTFVTCSRNECVLHWAIKTNDKILL